MENFSKQSLAPGLYLVGVPIGAARDITLRALDVLASADVLAAEDTRSLRKLMEIHGVPLNGRRIQTLHDHSGDSAQARLLDAVASGQSVAYASEAGMPLIADPGFELVRAARARDLRVTAAPGASSVPTALALAGLPTDAFHFAGFLPSTKAARRAAFERLQTLEATLVIFESPHRLAASLRDAAEVLGPERRAAVCRELTKKFEETLTGTLDELAHRVETNPVKGEIVLLIDRGAAMSVSEASIEEMLAQALQDMSLKDAAAFVASATGEKKRKIYQMALSLGHGD